MGTETELKFEVAPQDLRKLKTAPALHRKPPKEENLISVYFDTPKHKLARNGVSLRVRHNGDKRLQTVKSEGSDGSFRRSEWEREIKGNVPDLRKAPGTALAPLLTKRLKRRLKPIFATSVHRTSIPVSKNGSRIEVALDEGQLRAGRLSASISELELELKRGKAGDVFKVARELAKLVPAKLELKSKAERGYDLIEHKPIQAVRAEKIKLRRGTRHGGRLSHHRSVDFATHHCQRNRGAKVGLRRRAPDACRPAPPACGYIAVLQIIWRQADGADQVRAQLA